MKTLQSFMGLKLIAACLLWAGVLVVHGVAQAQAPGQDTIVLNSAPSFAGGGANPERPGKGLDERQDMPIALKAKIARYTALSMARGEDDAGSQTIVQRAESAGFNKTCVQDIASNTAPSGLGTGRYGPRAQDQVVVLRGDFVNVCR
jgi:hypothetical protein